MAVSAVDWVPGGAWLAPGYAEWAPPPALRGMVACLWASIAPEDASRDALVLPDACSDLIWEQGAGSYVAGPDTGPVRIGHPAWHRHGRRPFPAFRRRPRARPAAERDPRPAS